MVGKRTNMRAERTATRRAKWVEYARRVAARSNRTPRPVPVWDWKYDVQGGALEAWTRGEARSMVKDILGIKKRLPKEVELVARAK